MRPRPGYKELYRLISMDYGDGVTQSYTFDNMGNRLTKTEGGTTETYGYNAANMLVSPNGQPYVNDLNGNTLSGGGRTNTWDSQNRLVQCVSGGIRCQFVYGPEPDGPTASADRLRCVRGRRRSHPSRRWAGDDGRLAPGHDVLRQWRALRDGTCRPDRGGLAARVIQCRWVAGPWIRTGARGEHP